MATLTIESPGISVGYLRTELMGAFGWTPALIAAHLGVKRSGSRYNEVEVRDGVSRLVEDSIKRGLPFDRRPIPAVIGVLRGEHGSQSLRQQWRNDALSSFAAHLLKGSKCPGRLHHYVTAEFSSMALWGDRAFAREYLCGAAHYAWVRRLPYQFRRGIVLRSISGSQTSWDPVCLQYALRVAMTWVGGSDHAHVSTAGLGLDLVRCNLPANYHASFASVLGKTVAGMIEQYPGQVLQQHLREFMREIQPFSNGDGLRVFREELMPLARSNRAVELALN